MVHVEGWVWCFETVKDESLLLPTGTRKIESYWNVDTCEVAATQFGLQVALRLGVHYAHLEGDSMNVVQAIVNSRMGLTPIFLFYAISILKCQFLDFLCTHVCRSGNSLAHEVTKWDTGVTHEIIYMEPFLQGFYTLAELDRQVILKKIK